MPCRRCKLHGAECVYKAIVRQSKAQLPAEVENLPQRQRNIELQLSNVIKAGHYEEALEHLRNGGLIGAGLEALNSAQPSNSCDVNMIEPGMVKPIIKPTLGDSRAGPGVDNPALGAD
jgi:precorrin isomerase